MRRLRIASVFAGVLLLVMAIVSCMQPGPGKPAAMRAGREIPAVRKEPAGLGKPEAERASPCRSFFEKSLHFTGEGMRYWYEGECGFMQVTGIPYKDLGCKSCHVYSCDACHGEKKNGRMVFSISKSRERETCLVCHARAKAAAKFDKKAGVEDVHVAAGLVCADCHGQMDAHCDGESYNSMRAPGAVKVSCSTKDCHGDLDMTIPAHKKHGKKKIDCAACHVSSTITCMNCHFDHFRKVKKRVPGKNFFPAKSWTLLVQHEGRVTTGNAQTLVCKGRKFVAYVPYFTHSVVKKGRKCNDCHNNEAAARMLKGQRVDMARFADGKVTHYEGVVPFVPDLLAWPWLDKDKDDKWVRLKTDEKPIIQKACYVEPLDEMQLKKLRIKMGE
jgi:hypothetical protein